MKTKLPIRLLAALLLSLSSLLTIATPLAHASAQNCLWNGSAGNNTFSSASNWSNCNNSVPQTGDILVFNPATGGSSVTLTNDLGVSFGGIINNPATYTSNQTNYVINTMSLTTGASLAVASTSNCNQYPTEIQFGTLHAAGNLTINEDGYYMYNTNLAVTGSLTLQSANGFGYMSANSGSTVGGTVTVASPTDYHTGSCSGNGGNPGAAPSGSAFSGFTLSGLALQNGAYTYLADSSFPITLGGGSGTTNPTIDFYANTDSNYNAVPTTYTISSPITLTGNATIFADDQVTANFTGAINGAGFSLVADPTSQGTVNFSPSSNNSSTPTGVQVNPVQTVTIASSDSQPNKFETVVNNETLVFDGERASIVVNRGGTLKGSGKTDYSTEVNNGGIIAPGHSPGCLTAADFYEYGTYQAEIGGTTACSGYDQLKQTDTVSAIDVTGGTLAVSLYGGFVPTVGQTYTIVDDAGTTSVVTGTFNGMAEGSTFTSQGVTYSISYKGGDGNDIVLTVTAVDPSLLPKVPATPDTGIALVAAHPLSTLITSTVAAGSLFFISRRLRPQL